MTSKYFFTLALLGGGVSLGALSGAGCSSSSPASTGTGGGTTTKTITHSTTSTTSEGTGGAGGNSAGNHDITMASMVAVDSSTPATLVDGMTSDWYTFNGTAGERVLIAAYATALQSEGKGFDPAVTDTTLVLVGSDMNVMMPLTYQDDGWPDFSQDAVLYVQSPATGAYYVGVQDCNALFSSGCPNPASGITGFDYTLVVADTSKLTNPELYAAAAQNGMTANAQPVKYVIPMGGKAGQYTSTLIGGDLQTATDTHVFSFTPPADTVVGTGARSRAEFYIQPIGTFQGGDLSDANIKIWATDSTGTKIISQSDQNNYVTNKTTYSLLEFSLPVTLGQQYYLFVQNTLAPAGGPMKDFYFVEHFLNPLIDIAEKEGPAGQGMNDTSATAEVLNAQGSAKDFFTVDGNISAPGSATMPDVDWFSFTSPTGVTQFQIQCDSQRSGSGVGAFTAQLFAADATTMIAMATETTTTDILTPAANVPSASIGKQMFLKLTGATQDAKVTGTQYRCYVFFG